MTPKTLTLAAIAVALYAGPAAAQANRTFVSGLGSDANPCSLAAPCRSFAQAITQTNPGGEIAVLDTAGYGAVTITKAVSIINQDGVEAGITVGSSDAIIIEAGTEDTITLRGLTIVGVNAGSDGIFFAGGRSLIVNKCAIRGFTFGGIVMATATAADLIVTDTTLYGNAVGIYVAPTDTFVLNGPTDNITLARVHATASSDAGIAVVPTLGGPAILASVTDSLIDTSGNVAIRANSPVGGTSLLVDHTKMVENQGSGAAITLSGNVALYLNKSTFFNRFPATVLVGSGAHSNSFGNNQAFTPMGAPVTF